MSNPKKRIGKYVIYMGNKIGSGSYSDVYLGIEEDTKEEIAVKVLRKDKIMEDEYTKNAFYAEIQINKKLKSPNIIRFYDVHETLNNFYIILELAKGGNLRASLHNSGRFQEKKTLKCLIQILNGFGEFAKHGITHRDLKPQNILIKDDVLKIADFGFAKQYEQKSAPLKTVVGTPAYMAPQILSQERYSYKCDIWSLGVIAYEMMVGKIPWTFTEKTIEGYRKEITTRQVVFPAWLEISSQMKDFIMGCLCRDEKKRFDWEQIFLHPLFGGKFSKNFSGKQEGATQLHFVMANLRLSLHSRNINLSRILARFGERLSEQDFLNLIASISREISPDQAALLYRFVAAPDGSVPVEAFQSLLVKYGCRLTGIDISKKEMQCEQNSAMRSSKPGIGVFAKIRAATEAIELKVRDVLQPKRFAKGDPLTTEAFSKLLRLLDPSLSEKELAFLFAEFDTDGDRIVTIQDAYNGVCKIAEIVPMQEE